MSEKNSVVTTVNVSGVALAEYDLSVFGLTIQSDGKTGPEAKEKLVKSVSTVDTCLKSLRDEGVNVEDATLRKSVRVSPIQVWNDKKEKHENRGYRATYTLGFTVTNVDTTSTVHDRLSSLNVDGLTVNDPDFKVKNLDGLHKEALKNAFERASVRFENECAVLGKTANNYEVSAWNVRYDESQGRRRDNAGPMRSFAAAGGSPMMATKAMSPISIEIDAGEAEVVATLNVTYSHKR